MQAELLARAGVGFIRLIDRDYVEWSNLQRQALYDEKDAETSRPKAVAAADRLRAINSTIDIEPAVCDLTPEIADDLLADVDLIMDGTDNFETRFLINDFALKHDIPWIYGAAVGSYGLKMSILPGKTCCLRCLMPGLPKGAQLSCETAGVLGPATTAIAALQAADALMILTGHIEQIANRLTVVDVWSGNIQQMQNPASNPDCPACGRGEYSYLTGVMRVPIALCGRNAVQFYGRDPPLT